jgi:hypothetical protein
MHTFYCPKADCFGTTNEKCISHLQTANYCRDGTLETASGRKTNSIENSSKMEEMKQSTAVTTVAREQNFQK